MTASALPRPVLAASGGHLAASVAGASERTGSALALWAMRARTRAALGRLDAGRHADLGLEAADVAREVAKPFWRA